MKARRKVLRGNGLGLGDRGRCRIRGGQRQGAPVSDEERTVREIIGARRAIIRQEPVKVRLLLKHEEAPPNKLRTSFGTKVLS